ncbi:MAG: PGPGW domain-containing protein [Gammaproteobacteria bacterium]
MQALLPMQALLSEYATALWWLGTLSAATLVVSAFAAPVLLARLPADYYAEHRDPQAAHTSRGLSGRALTVIRNVFAMVLVLAGVAMLVLPGQGLLTIAAGLAVLRFPGKRKAERWLIQRPVILGAANWLRRRRGRAPFEF